MPASSSVRASQSSSNPVEDAELRDQIAVFLRDRGLSSLEVAVSRGAVTLSGSVSSPYERQMAVMSVRRIAGVERLSDQIRMLPSRAPRPTAARRAADFGSGFLSALGDWFVGTPKAAWVVIALAFVVPVSMTSCGGPTEKQVTVHPVSGKVTFKGEPAEGAQVILHPKGHTLPDRTVPTARADASGAFKIGSYKAGDGAPPGDYVVTVVWKKVVASEGGAGPGPNVLPKEYASADTSPVQLTVKDGSNEIPPIELK